MLQHIVQLLASLAALVAILTGLGRHWEFWAIVKRAMAGYLAFYLIGGALMVLGRYALKEEKRTFKDSSKDSKKEQEINGTDAAI